MSGKKEKDTQKFFTLIFTEDNEEKTTKVPAKKGKSLKDSVEPILTNHGISVDSHSMFLGSSNTPLPFNSDTFPYGGNTLYIRANEKLDIDKRIINFMRNDSRKNSENLIERSSKRFSELLQNFDCNGNGEVYDAIDGLTNGIVGTEDDFVLEDNWNNIITEEEDMPNRLKVQQQAIWELFTTELSFIKDVKIIIDVFQACFRMLHVAGYLTEVKESLIFANIEEIYHVNVTFWRSLIDTIENARNTKKPIYPSQLLKAFEGFEELFQPYIEFCNADTSNLHLPDYLPSTNEKLKQYVAWCDNHERCKRITIAGFLIKPLQRVTKYSLLLKAILNKTDDENEKAIVEEIRSRVETFVSKINSAIHLRQEQEKLDNVVYRLSDYCPIEPVNDEVEKIIKEYCHLNFKGNIPGLSDDEKRFIIKEGPMKIVEKHGKKDVYTFLFSDVLVITKLKRNIDKYRINRQPYRLNKLVVRDLKDPGQLLFVYLNEYGVAAGAFICLVDLPEQDKWRSAIEKAKSNYELIRMEFGLRDEFWDDDLPTSSISKNKVLRRHAAIKKVKNQTSSSSEVIPQPIEPTEKIDMKYEWDTTLTIVGTVMFIAINVALSRILGYLW